ncbi:HNH endonuclease [Microscilla marina]|uniref:HNH endonuclease, putative n=1 Tax=Microscilla marina ATCC 23134 TaxID=313606 RepID=A1ZKH6_MICM2|nr:HNH endonuclease [Microscilla marina]EAY29202.1 HNH endonuclease, putative [Microscilla marina ATCC 23134]
MSKEILFRQVNPSRTYSGREYKNYRAYKSALRSDFNKRCGYCDCVDFWHGGENNFHVEHFAPKSLFPTLQTKYSNLIYSCATCNVAKGNDWVSNDSTIPNINGKGYVDPCNPSFVQHFSRIESGAIIPKSSIGRYMYIKLKLYLEKNRVMWMLHKIYEKINLIKDALKNQTNEVLKQELTNIFNELSTEFFRYLNYLEIQLN